MAISETDQAAASGRQSRQVFWEGGKGIGQPGPGSTKVGWTLRNSSGRILEAFSYFLNPQGITRGISTRAQVSATKGGFYVDNFGPGPNQINVRQLVASGRAENPSLGYTAREDIQRFLKNIYLPAQQHPNDRKVFFHDHHFERGFEEQVFFPQNGVTITRSVEQHNVWLVEMNMTGLERYPFSEVAAVAAPTIPYSKYLVKKGDTVTKLAAYLSGKTLPNSTVRKAIVKRIYELNPRITKARTRKVDGATEHLKAMKIYAGESILLPVRSGGLQNNPANVVTRA